jgi:hypothetical protein
MTQVSPPKLLLVVDTFLRDRSVAEHVGVERAIAMATSLASHALEAGLMVGLFAWGAPFDLTSNLASKAPNGSGHRNGDTPTPAPPPPPAGEGNWLGIPPNRGKRHRVDVLAHLAQLPLNTTKDTQSVLEASRDFIQSGATPILVTPRDIQVGLGDQARSSLIVLSAVHAGRWFTFDSGIDFSRSMPWNQQPEVGDEEEKRELRSEKREEGLEAVRV